MVVAVETARHIVSRHSPTPALEMVIPTYKVGFPAFNYKPPHSRAQSFVS